MGDRGAPRLPRRIRWVLGFRNKDAWWWRLYRPPYAVPRLFQLSPFRAKATFRVSLRVDSRKQSPIWGLRWPSSSNP